MAKMFIGGESVDSVTKNTTEVRNPATGATVDTVPQGNDKDVQQAIQAAEEAFQSLVRCLAGRPRQCIAQRRRIDQKKCG